MTEESISRKNEMPNNETPKNEMVESKPLIPKKMASVRQELKNQIVTLRLVVLGLFIALIVAITSIMSVVKDITVHVPPDLSEGVSMKIGDYPKANVLTNTNFLWVAINTWKESGSKEAIDNLNQYQNYMSEDFKKQLTNILNNRALDRKRRLTLADGSLSGFDKRVIVLNKGSWVVVLDYIEEEWYLGERIRHSKIRYPIEVEQTTSSADVNPIQLKLIGFYKPPTVIEDMK